jgi:hypothetical protein
MPAVSLEAKAHFRAYQRDYMKRRKEENKQFVRVAKSYPCLDCGRSYPPAVMEFDHVRGDKTFQVARRLSMPLARLRQEIAKCEAVCANCHRLRHARVG